MYVCMYGGFGVRLPSIVYRTSVIAHLISMLNHEEEMSHLWPEIALSWTCIKEIFHGLIKVGIV